MQSPTERFSDRVKDYIKYRPSYPAALIDTLVEECGLTQNSAIADIGSGTGKLSEMLLARDLSVSCIEPNREMREAAESLLSSQRNFTSFACQSEATGLADNSIDLVTAAQAFHWFDVKKTKAEFERILKPQGRIALIWNERNIGHAFQREYDEMLLLYAPEYASVNHRNVKDTDVAAFYRPRSSSIYSFDYSQKFDLTAFLGRMQSSSYIPKSGTEELKILIAAAEALFEKHEQSGVIEFTYETNLYLST